jgi:polynucleotide 5'-hydroxyl-kinase GRC3/NOL9
MATISKLLPEGRTVLVCGSGGTGKSTFCRASTNRLLADQAFLRHISGSKGGVLLLDLDLTQPELTPPGLIYLAHVKSALLGSPDSHYAMPGSSQNHILRMHYLGGIDVDSVSSAGMNAIKDLLQYCDTIRKDYPGCPVLINSSSWLLDMESTKLSNLLLTMRLSDIVYFDSSGSLKHRELLARCMGDKCNLWGLASKVYRSAPASTIRWSYMQSYFHLVSSKPDEPTWDRLALLSSNWKELTYSGPNSVVWVFVTLGEQLALGNIAQALEDSIVAIVAVEMEESCEGQADHLRDEFPWQVSGHLAPSAPEMLDGQPANPAYIVRTGGENLPYFYDVDLQANILRPQRSECLGLAYINAIDPVREIIEIVTPIPQQIMSAQRDKGLKLAIVMGKQDRQWAPMHG